jgi:oligopeptide/dipeptide ABC transporter ATP-binding protein
MPRRADHGLPAEPGTAASAQVSVAASSTADLLRVEDLSVRFATRRGPVRAVDGISFELGAGGRLGIVGESGSGKTITALSLLRLADGPGVTTTGRIWFRGTDLAGLGERELRAVRGRDIGLIPQDPMTTLNPLMKVGRQITEAIRAHQQVSRAAAAARAVELLRLTGMPAPELRAGDHPHQLSGGMRQRVLIAMALANEPELLILDEPTTALDATVQAQILTLIRELQERTGSAILLISHDVAVIGQMCTEIIVMYGGRIMERGSTEQITRDPKHPYTAGLIGSVPARARKGIPLTAIPGAVPDPSAMPPGCPFATRCSQVMDRCATAPPYSTLPDGRKIACWLYEQ